MSATRVTLFICDLCGEERKSPENYDLPLEWEYVNEAGKRGKHYCEKCKFHVNCS